MQDFINQSFNIFFDDKKALFKTNEYKNCSEYKEIKTLITEKRNKVTAHIGYLHHNNNLNDTIYTSSLDASQFTLTCTKESDNNYTDYAINIIKTMLKIYDEFYKEKIGDFDYFVEQFPHITKNPKFNYPILSKYDNDQNYYIEQFYNRAYYHIRQPLNDIYNSKISLFLNSTYEFENEACDKQTHHQKP